MRLYPPAWIIDRVATEDDDFQGVMIPKGSVFSLYVYGMHHHAGLWPAAEALLEEDPSSPRSYRVRQDFLDVISDFRNWTVSDQLREQFPQLCEGVRWEPVSDTWKRRAGISYTGSVMRLL